MKSRRHTAAFTMVELMIALAIAIVVTWGLYDLYVNYVKAFVAQDRVIETQQTARIAMDTLTQDLLRAGYKVAGTTPAISYAGTGMVEVQLFNEAAGVQERIRYFVDGTNNLVREVYRDTGGWVLQNGAPGTSALSGVLAQDVRFQDLNENAVQDAGEAPALQFTYYTETAFSTNPVTPTALNVTTPLDADSPAEAGAATNVASLLDIREVRVALTVRSSQRDPVRGKFVYRTLRADVKPRNAGLMSTIKDASPPAVPTGLASVDRGDCGYLYISWNENTEPDLAGYVLHYGNGTPPGVYFASATITKGTPHSTANPYVLSGLPDGTQLYLVISAFDYSGNSSPLSAELTGTAGSADTTPNVGDPESAPAAFAGVAGLGQVALTWDRVDEPDIAGYRVWRKTTAFTNPELLTLASTGSLSDPSFRQVADETMFTATPDPRVTATASGWRLVDDVNTDLKGCVDYYYAVTAIKGCGHPTTSYTAALFSKTGPHKPTDTTPPAPPSPMLTAFPSYLRNYLTLNNPSTTDPANKDFTHTVLAYKTGTSPNYPTFTVNPVTGAVETDGTLLECYTSAYGQGTFTASGTIGGILHKGANGTCAATYSLNPVVTYYYAAVAVDTCKNLSNPATTNAQVAATQCSDETEPGHPAVGNPPRVTGVHGNTARSLGGPTTSEATLAWTPIDDSFAQIRDLAGYYVFRSTPGDAPGSTPFPTLSDFDGAKGLLLTPSVTYTGLTEGKIDRVRILGVDCETVTQDDAAHTFLNGRYGTSFNTYASDTLIFYPGTFLLDTLVATKVLGKNLNFVEFQAKNTINAAATPTDTDTVEFKTLTFDWTTPNGGAGSDRLLKSVVIRNGTTTFTITPASPVASGTPLSAAGIGFRGGANTTFVLEFINSSTGTGSQARMRDFRIDVRAVYVPVTRLNGDTAAPFVFDAAQQADVRFTVPAARAPDINGVWDANTSAANWHPATTSPLDKPATVAAPDPYPYPATEAVDFLVDVIDNSSKGLDRIRVFYATTAKTVMTPPALGDTLPGSAPGYTALIMCDNDGATVAPSCGGSGFYASFGLVPPQAGQRVWYFVVVEDRGGNFAVGPAQDTSVSTLAYTYDHLP